jgi:hypothetical protein
LFGGLKELQSKKTPAVDVGKTSLNYSLKDLVKRLKTSNPTTDKYHSCLLLLYQLLQEELQSNRLHGTNKQEVAAEIKGSLRTLLKSYSSKH